MKWYLVLSSFLFISLGSCKNQTNDTYQEEEMDEEISLEQDEEDALFDKTDSLVDILDSAMFSMDNEDTEGAYEFLIEASQYLKQQLAFESDEDSLLLIKAVTQLKQIAKEVMEKKIKNSNALEEALNRIDYSFREDNDEIEMDDDE